MKRCIVCDSASPPRPHWGGLVRCADCGFVWADLELSDEEVAELYSADYFQGEEYSDYVRDRDALQRSFERQAAILRRHAPGGSLFDIGCAYGFFLDVARRHWEPVAGIDVSADATAYARDTLGLDARTGDFLTADIEPGAWDTFTCWATLEHLTRPGDYLARVGELLPPGGHFAVSTLDIDSLHARLLRSRWRLIHPPTHLFYWSRRTLTRLLDRCGMDVVHFSYIGSHRSIEGMLHGLLAERRPGLYRALARRVPSGAMLYLNTFDAMYLVARKRGGPDAG